MIDKRGGTLALGFSVLLFGTFLFSIFIFSNQFATDNNAPISISGDTNLNQNLQMMNGSLRTYYNSNNVTISGLYGSSIEPGSDTLSRVSTFQSGSETSLPDVGNSSRTALLTLFGGDSRIYVIAGAFIAFLGLVVVLYGWKTLKGGAPD